MYNTIYLFVLLNYVNLVNNRSYEQQQEIANWENAVEEAILNLQRIIKDQNGQQVQFD
jgi:hypothetical protein